MIGTLTPLYVLVGVWVAAALYVHLRGRERLSLMRQVADHSTFLAPYNAFVYFTSAVPNRPMLDPAQVPGVAALTAHWREIRDLSLIHI